MTNVALAIWLEAAWHSLPAPRISRRRWVEVFEDEQWSMGLRDYMDWAQRTWIEHVESRP